MKKVLLVDDDLAILDALQIILSDAGYATKTVREGENVLSAVDDFHPDMLFLDIWMSGKDGLEVAAELKKNDKTKHIPIVMISALSHAEKAARQIGADDYLMKPFTIAEVLTKTKKYTGE